MTRRQWAEWQAFAELEPWGGLREDYRAAVLASVIVNAIPKFGKSAGKALRPDDVFATLRDARTDRPQSVKGMMLAAELITRRMGGQVVKVRRGETPPPPAGKGNGKG